MKPISFNWQNGGGYGNANEGLAVSEDHTGPLSRSQTLAVAQPVNFYGGNKRPDRPDGGFYVRTDEDTSKTLDAASGLNPCCSQGGTAVMQPVPYDLRQVTAPVNRQNRAPGDPCHALAQDNAAHAAIVAPQPVAIGLDEEQNARLDGFGTLKARTDGGGFEGSVMTPSMQVRRLTCVECERLQGFPDGWTAIPWRNKPASECPDGPRYKALGNSMAVPVMRWIGQQLDKVK